MLPGADGVMAAAGQLHVDDASWLDNSGFVLVHPGLAQAAAEVLGVRSVRWVVRFRIV